MKTWKKVLIGVVVLGAVVVALLGYGALKMTDEFMAKMEPDMRQYVQMDTVGQNKYIETHLDGLLSALKDKNNSEDTRLTEAVMNDPQVRQAGIEWGRSICAYIVLGNEAIANELSPDVKAKFEQEAAEQDNRANRFSAECERVEKAVKGN